MSWVVSKKNGRTVELGDGRKITVPACPKNPPQAWSDARKIAAADKLLQVLQDVYRDGLQTNCMAWRLTAKLAIENAGGIADE